MGMEKEQSKVDDIRGKKAKPISYNLDLLPVRTTTRGSNGPQNVTQLTNDHPSRMKVMLQ